jgi:hypothetical protein
MNALLVEGKAWLFGRGGKVGRGKIFADHQIGAMLKNSATISKIVVQFWVRWRQYLHFFHKIIPFTMLQPAVHSGFLNMLL